MSATLGERLFWPTVVFATLALGGFVYFFATAFNARPYKPRAPIKVAAAVAPAQNAQPAIPVAAAGSAGEAESPKAADSAETSAPSDDIAESGGNGAQTGTAALAPAEEESPYVVPDHKPFLSRDDFAKKPAPKRKRPAQNLPIKKPATASAPMPGAAPPSAPKSELLRLIDHRKLVVLGSGRKIVAQSIVDLGDSYGIKDDRNQMLTVKKSDVARIERP